MKNETLQQLENDSFNYERIEKAIQFLGSHFKEQPGLDELAKEIHVSPFHLQRLFTEWAGISPKRFLQYLTTGYLKEKLQDSKSLIDAAESAGLSSQSRVYDLFVNLEAVTPQEYKEKGKGIQIGFGFHPTPFGECLIATTERGICGLSFLKDGNKEEAFNDLGVTWENASLKEDKKETAKLVQDIFSAHKPGRKFNLLVKGTNFQVKVWEALLKIPTGAVTTYQGIASSIQNPKALQAVGSAIGSNHIAYLIPCHRVIRKEGVSGEYRWGGSRKRSMLGYEMAKTEGVYHQTDPLSRNA